MKKKIMFGIGMMLALASIMLVSAEFWGCFTDGDVVNYCNPDIPDFNCDSTLCLRCLSYYNETGECYGLGSWNRCNTIPLECNGEEDPFDFEPPVITLSSPVENAIYTERSVLFDLEVNERADIYYVDNANYPDTWKRLCRECLSYSDERSLKDGMNDITFKAVDMDGNEGFLEHVNFFVDSKDPKFTKTEPRRGFASGLFMAQIKEDNPKILTLHYGNFATGFRDEDFNPEEVCYEDRNKVYCDAEVDVEDYDAEEIEYWFVLEDIAGNSVESKHIELSVDTTFPEYDMDYRVEGRYVYFDFNVEEDNFDEISYSYVDSYGRLKEKRLCSRLDDEGMCSVKKSFSNGHYDLTIQVLDEAGNSVGEGIGFDVSY